jgi:RNA polymerase sigma-70 factor (ECF subfamily)
MYALAAKQLQCEDTAKDCVQEVFVALWKRRDEQHITNLESYLLQSVRFQACKAMRNKQMNRLRCRLAFVSPSHTFSDPALLRDMHAGFYRAISGLPEDQRRIFYMNREEAATYSRIAELLGISVKTVEKKMSLALKALRKQAEMV